VSHDRHLLKTVTDELIIVHQGKAEEFEGDLDDYAAFISQAAATNNKAGESQKGAELSNNVLSKKEQRQADAQRRKQLQPLMDTLKKSEKELEQLTEKKSELEKHLANPDIYTEENKERLKKYLLEKSEIDKNLENVEVKWMEISEEYENAAAEIE
jgi:ATP-binding cassette subfamily F protein 3